MPLNWQLDKIKDWKKICQDKAGKLEARTDVLIRLMVCIGVTRITEDNYEEVYFRLRCLEMVHGPFLYQSDRMDNPVEDPFALRHVRDHIGLSTNVSNWSRAKFWKDLQRRMEQVLEDEIEFENCKT